MSRCTCVAQLTATLCVRRMRVLAYSVEASGQRCSITWEPIPSSLAAGVRWPVRVWVQIAGRSSLFFRVVPFTKVSLQHCTGNVRLPVFSELGVVQLFFLAFFL